MAYKLVVASLHSGQIVASGFLFCSSVSSIFSSLRPPSSLYRRYSSLAYAIPSYYAAHDYDRRFLFLRGLSFSDHRFLFRPVILCFMFYVSRFMFYCLPFWVGFLWGLSVLDHGFGLLCLVLRLWQRIETLLSLRQSSRLFLPPPRVVSSRLRLLRRSSPSPSSRDLHLSLGLGLRPSTFGSSSIVLVVC